METISKQHFTGEGYEPASQGELLSALEFMERVAKKPFLNEESKMIANMRIADYKLGLGRDEQVESMLKSAEPRLSSLEGTGSETAVKSSFYRVEANYYKKIGPAGAFHSSVMQYLAYTPFDSMPRDRRLKMAVDIAVASLVAEDVFNIGDVLRHELIRELATAASHKWLYDLLVIFNEGDVKAFNKSMDANQSAIAASPTIVASMENLKQKVALLCLVRIVFDRPPHERDVSFVDIAEVTLLPLDQVEWLVMRAFSKKLLQGTMDEIDQIVHVTWLMPRVLDASQTKSLDEKLAAWSKIVDAALLFEMHAPELFSST